MAMTPRDPQLPRDEALERLYRDAAREEPGPALDARILEAARQAAAPRRRPRPWWRGLLLPVSALATVVLAVSLALRVDLEQEAGDGRLPMAPLPQADQGEAEESRAVPQPSPGSAAPPAATPGRDSAPRTLMRQAPKAQEEAAPASKPAPPPAAAPLPAPRRAPEPVLEAAPPAPAAMPEERAKRRDEAPAGLAAPRAAEEWLEEIRALRRAGREQEAAEALQRFRRTYPGYPLPEDLR